MVKRVRKTKTPDDKVQAHSVKPEVKEKDTTGYVTYRKEGGGSFVFNNRFIKPGQTFQARPGEIPKGFKDVVVPVKTEEEVKAQKEAVEEEKEKTEYSLKHKGGGYYNIVDGDEKVVNEKPLKKEEAEELLKTL